MKKIKEEINKEIVGIVEKQPTKKMAKWSNKCYIFFFVVKEPFKKDDVEQKDFLQDLDLLIVNNNLPL